MSPDAKTFTFKLKPGVKFQNGEPLTADDVKFSFARAAAADSTNKDKAFFASIDSIATPDPLTVVIAFKQPSFDALFHFGQNTAVILEPKSAPTDATNPVGTGPYKLGAWNRGASITLDKWDGFRDPAKIAIAHATFKFINDAAAQTAALLAGDVDAYPLFGALESLGQFKDNAKFQVSIGGSEGKTIVAINNKRKPFDDLSVRQAIAYAIDRSAIIEGAMSGMANADRQPRGADRSRLPRFDRRISARPGQGQGLAESGGRGDAAERHADASAAALRAPKRRDRRCGAARGWDRGEDRQRRMGAMAVGRVQRQGL